MFSVTELFELNFGILTSLLRKEIIKSHCCFRFRCEHLFIFSQIYCLWILACQRAMVLLFSKTLCYL